jgi:hypothetical protein
VIPALLLAVAAPQTAVEAERAFAADAQRIGQWTAFLKWAAPDALMFVPEPTNAHAFLKPLRDPAKPVDWWPTKSFVSCDGKMAVNVGNAIWPDGHASRFSTIWSKDGRKWRWKFDHGINVSKIRPRPADPEVRRAACDNKPKDGRIILQFRMTQFATGSGGSPDGTLTYHWHIANRGQDPTLNVWLWDGTEYSQALISNDPPPAQP